MEMNLIYFLIPASVMILIGIYFYFYLIRMAKFWKMNVEKKVVKIGIIALTVILIALSFNIWGSGAIILLHVFVISIFMELINLICKRYKRWSSVYQSGFVPISFAAIILIYGYFNMMNVVQTNYKVYTDRGMRDKGYRVAMIADLHYGANMNQEKLYEYCDVIAKQNPDIVVLCGDIIDEDTTYPQMQEAIQALGSIKSTYGTYYVYGNHDKNNYSTKPYYTVEQLDDELLKNKILFLQDDTYSINDDLIIVGRDDVGFAGENQRKKGRYLISEVDSDRFILLLDHQPCELKENDKLGYDLELSGHTHAGQIWPIGQSMRVLKIGELNYGYEKLKNMQAIVTSGMAGWGYPIRTGSNSEYVIIDIQPQ